MNFRLFLIVAVATFAQASTAEEIINAPRAVVACKNKTTGNDFKLFLTETRTTYPDQEDRSFQADFSPADSEGKPNWPLVRINLSPKEEQEYNRTNSTRDHRDDKNPETFFDNMYEYEKIFESGSLMTVLRNVHSNYIHLVRSGKSVFGHRGFARVEIKGKSGTYVTVGESFFEPTFETLEDCVWSW